MPDTDHTAVDGDDLSAPDSNLPVRPLWCLITTTAST